MHFGQSTQRCDFGLGLSLFFALLLALGLTSFELLQFGATTARGLAHNIYIQMENQSPQYEKSIKVPVSPRITVKQHSRGVARTCRRATHRRRKR